VTRRVRSKALVTDSFAIELEPLTEDAAWFVYMFTLTDCTGFKVGFSCNPLQRVCTFSSRYFERFDLAESTLFAVADCDASRAVEADLKTLLGPHRIEAPDWVPLDAGGHTEWFSAVYFDDAKARLHELANGDLARFSSAFDRFASQLARVRQGFELWAISQVQRVSEAREFVNRGYAVRDQSAPLRDWLAAYRYFDIPLFADDPELLRSIQRSVGMATD